MRSCDKKNALASRAQEQRNRARRPVPTCLAVVPTDGKIFNDFVLSEMMALFHVFYSERLAQRCDVRYSKQDKRQSYSRRARTCAPPTFIEAVKINHAFIMSYRLRDAVEVDHVLFIQQTYSDVSHPVPNVSRHIGVPLVPAAGDEVVEDALYLKTSALSAEDNRPVM